MPIARDLSHLDREEPDEPDSMPPDTPSVGVALVNEWERRYTDAGLRDKAMAVEGARFRHSWAGMCARLLGYLMSGTEPSNPKSVADIWRMNIGTMVHDALQASLAEVGQAEVPVSIRRGTYFTAGHADLVVDEIPDGATLPERTVTEVKTINGFGFKMAASTFKGPPQGPRHSAVLQASLNALGLDADNARVVYLSLENLSPNLVHHASGPYGQFLAEWNIPNFREVATEELERIDRIVAFLDAGAKLPRAIPDPELPKGARITNPGDGRKHGTWQLTINGVVAQTGTTWHCAYCDFRDQCHADGA